MTLKTKLRVHAWDLPKIGYTAVNTKGTKLMKDTTWIQILSTIYYGKTILLA